MKIRFEKYKAIKITSYIFVTLTVSACEPENKKMENQYHTILKKQSLLLNLNQTKQMLFLSAYLKHHLRGSLKI